MSTYMMNRADWPVLRLPQRSTVEGVNEQYEVMTDRGPVITMTVEDLKRRCPPERRVRMDEIKQGMIDAERGYELAALRRAQGLTQAQVAETMGITQGRVSQMERGQTHLTTTTMAAYLEAIGGELTILATVGNVSVRL